jgi:hypothetical protein
MQPLKNAERGPGVHAREEVGFTIGAMQRHWKENSAFVFVLILDSKAEFRHQPTGRPGSGLFRGVRCISGGLIPWLCAAWKTSMPFLPSAINRPL